ncbi:MAG: hypothetical protein E7623_02140 [Ruminococcaceae bacterium]|nr:hypothetical protein [Oscillospiraceae bacterium]
MEYGYMKVNVRTAGGSLPVEGAIVKILSTKEAASDVLYTLYTNASGVTERVSLEAPDRALSESPGNQNVYAKYNLIIQKDGYYRVEDYDAPVFSGITSIQNTELIPLPEGTKNGDEYMQFFENREYDL